MKQSDLHILKLMKLTTWLAGMLMLLYITKADAQSLDVLDWKSEYTLNTHLLQQVHEQYNQRKQKLAAAWQSKEKMQAYLQKSRERYKNLVGQAPSFEHLNPVVTGKLQAEGYTIEKVIYQSFVSHHVTANFYLPEGSGPFPAALLFCGHEPLAKATISYQKTAALLALHGIAVLVIDPISQGERHQLTDEQGKPLTRGGTTEHTILNEGANLLGTSVVAWELWDNLAGLEYLLNRPEVDAEKIGALGNSGGGTMTTYFMAFEDRIKLAAPCSYVASRERNFELVGANDGCQHLPAEGLHGFEISDFLLMAAPKPVLVLAGKYDFVDYTGTLQAFAEVEKAYQVMGEPEKVRLFTYADGHGISKPKREEAVRWFRKWFYGDVSPVIEGEIKTFNTTELNCTISGQVNTEFSDEQNIKDLQMQVADELARQRKSLSASELQEKIAQVLNLEQNPNPVVVESKGMIESQEINWQKLILRKKDEIPLPVLLAQPKGKIDKVLFWLPDAGKASVADQPAEINQYLKSNTAVILADLRGMGETADRKEKNEPKYYNAEYHNAMTAIHLGQPLTAGRVQDVFTLLEFVREHDQMRRAEFLIKADGVPAFTALHAAAMEPDISQLDLDLPFQSFNYWIENPLEKDGYSYVVPGVLQHYDLPDLIHLLNKQKRLKEDEQM